jgi:hypothetical protein
VTPQTASGHLGRLVEAGLLVAVKQGRNRYYALASAVVARMIESIMQVAAQSDPPARRIFVGPRDKALRRARTCYDHIAGRLGVGLADGLVAAGHVELSHEGGMMTESGLALIKRLGIELGRGNDGRSPSGRLPCRPCLDWSERRPHLAGAVGAAIYRHSLAENLVRRIEGTRALGITPKGLQVFRETFGVRLDDAI